MLFSRGTYDENVVIRRDLPSIARVAHLNPANLTYVDSCFVISEWLKANARS